jgi:hypothetical protein
MKARGKRREAVCEECSIVAVVIHELVDGRIDVTIGNLIQRTDNEVPPRIEFMFESKLTDLGLQIDSEKRQLKTSHRRIRSVPR